MHVRVNDIGACRRFDDAASTLLAEPSGKAERILTIKTILQIMAKIFYLLKQNNIKNSKVKGKWFAHGKTVEGMNTRKMA